MLTLGEKIAQLRKACNLSQGQLAIKLDTSRSSISLWEANMRKPNYTDLNKLAGLFNVTTDYLISITTVPNGEVITKITVMTHKIPVYGRIPDGTPFEAIQDLLEEVEIPSWLAEKKGLFGLKVVGDSMNKVLPDGSIAVLQKTETLNNGEIGAILVNGFDATLKKFYQLTESIVLESLSYNPDNKPLVYTDGTEIRPIGKLVWFCAAQGW